MLEPMRMGTNMAAANQQYSNICHWVLFCFKSLYSAANDPQTGNDPQIGPQMIPNRK